MSEREVRLEKSQGVATLTLHQPARRNAMTQEMWQQLANHARGLRDDSSVRCVVLRGAGREAFVAGADISEFQELRTDPNRARAYDDTTSAAFDALLALDQPVVACIHGNCVGGGVAISLCCDLRYASADATFALPPARLGLGYGLDNLSNAVRVLGPTAARELFLTARRLDAGDALHLGLLNEVVPGEHLDSRVDEIVRGICQNAPLTLKAVKRSLRALADGGDTARKDAQDAIDRCFSSADYQEGVAAFLEKRKPQFKGS